MTEHLKKIDSPSDLKKLSLRELEQLAQELREEIIGVVSRTGGHLAASLGVVELTLALYRVFNLPEDKIVWDVGHQAYAHKILTGRRRVFKTQRQYGGISGFPKISESPYDFFGVGHASTSISAALGMAAARDRRGGKEKIIAVIGDGALTGGLAWEALNQVEKVAKNTLIVLNANNMAIAPGLGAVHEYLNRIISAPIYNRVRRDLRLIMKKIPTLGDRMVEAVRRLEEAVKGFVIPGVVFEEFGYRYLGPVDGHNLDSLVNILDNIKRIDDPVFLHVVTQKGRGYTPAEGNPEYFHGTGPFFIKSGRLRRTDKHLSYSDVFGRTLVSLAEHDDRIVAVTAAMPLGTGLTEFARRFPDRFFDVGIAEAHALTFAAGMAVQGLRPVVAIYSTFLQRALDQIIHDICLQELPVVLAIDRAGLVGEDGPTHHGVFDLGFLRAVPGLTLMQPKDGTELSRLLVTALKLSGPVALRYHRGRTDLTEINPPFSPLPAGKAELIRDGRDGLIWALGPMVAVAEAAGKILKKEKLDFGVVNTRFIKPLDEKLLLSAARRGKKIVSLEEASLAGGLGSSLLEVLERADLNKGEVLRIGIEDNFIPQGSISRLWELCGLTPEAVAKQIKKRFGRRG